MDAGVAFEMDQLRNIDAPRYADPAEVIAQQVDDHHVFGTVFFAANQFSGLIGIPFWIGISRACSLNGPCLNSTIREHFHEAFRRCG